MKTKFMMILALLLTMLQGIWAQTPMTKTGDNTWTAPMPTYNILLHADYWGEFAISYELNGGVNHADNPAMYYEDEQVTLKAPLKEDYIFLGWTGSNGETPQEEVTIAQGSTGDKNYIANWQLDEEKVKLRLLTELYDALGDDVWTGYGANTGVISYSRGDEPNSFKATFMGGTYSFDLPFEAFTSVSKTANEDGSHTYTLVVNLPAQTGLGSETLHVTLNANGEITGLDSENAGIEMQKEEGPVTGWAALQAAMNNGGVIKLGENVIAESTDEALVIPADKTVVLELNGFSINRGLTAAVENGSVIVNNGTLAIMGEGQITGGNTTGNGGGVLNNGIFTLYGGEITGNAAAIGGGVYNNGGAQGFWMTGGLIDNNAATTNPAIGGEVIFNENAAVQIDAEGTQVTIEQALANLATYSYIKPVMPNYEDLTPTTFAIALKSDTENADQVVLSTETALEGIVISVTPKEGYEITDFTAYYVVVEDQVGSRYEIDATLDPETGAYSFVMPAADVTIEATIVKKQATAIDNAAVDTKATKRIENGQLLIIRDGKTYNVVGTVVR